jgi:hypothetical protein
MLRLAPAAVAPVPPASPACRPCRGYAIPAPYGRRTLALSNVPTVASCGSAPLAAPGVRVSSRSPFCTSNSLFCGFSVFGNRLRPSDLWRLAMVVGNHSRPLLDRLASAGALQCFALLPQQPRQFPQSRPRAALVRVTRYQRLTVFGLRSRQVFPRSPLPDERRLPRPALERPGLRSGAPGAPRQVYRPAVS